MPPNSCRSAYSCGAFPLLLLFKIQLLKRIVKTDIKLPEHFNLQLLISSIQSCFLSFT
uniref:Uncharacterized protein n=1 Tax=Rhizophora mucronata TaxID=61149 RepID=A0A2P2MYE4_RHIMU